MMFCALLSFSSFQISFPYVFCNQPYCRSLSLMKIIFYRWLTKLATAPRQCSIHHNAQIKVIVILFISRQGNVFPGLTYLQTQSLIALHCKAAVENPRYNGIGHMPQKKLPFIFSLSLHTHTPRNKLHSSVYSPV